MPLESHSWCVVSVCETKLLFLDGNKTVASKPRSRLTIDAKILAIDVINNSA